MAPFARLAVIALFASALACTDGTEKAATPGFEDHPVTDLYQGKPAALDLDSHPRARLFRTRLEEGVRRGPNFAGHYTVVTWGCGSPCQMLAIVDAESGRVYIAQFALSFGAEFRLKSRLLIADPAAAIRDFYRGERPESPLFTHSYYYVWTGGELKLVESVNVWRD